MTLELEDAFLLAEVVNVRFLWQRVLFVSYLHHDGWKVILVGLLVAQTLKQALSIRVAKHVLGEKTAKLLEFFGRDDNVGVPAVNYCNI